MTEEEGTHVKETILLTAFACGLDMGFNTADKLAALTRMKGPITGTDL